MEWTTLNAERLLLDFPTDLLALYNTWIIDHPDKAGRLAQVTAETVARVRDAISSRPVNVLDPDPDAIPVSAVQAAETLVYGGLAMEMGIDVTSEANQMMTRADLFVRQIAYGHYRTESGAAEAVKPTYQVPVPVAGGRALPAVLGLLVLFWAGTASAGWVKSGWLGGGGNVVLPDGTTITNIDAVSLQGIGATGFVRNVSSSVGSNHLATGAVSARSLAPALRYVSGFSNDLGLISASDSTSLATVVAGEVVGAHDADAVAHGGLIASALQAENDTLNDVVQRGSETESSVSLGGVAVDVNHFRTNVYGGSLVLLGPRVQAGEGSDASGQHSYAFGYVVTAAGDYSFASGFGTLAAGDSSFTAGYGATASNASAFAWQGGSDPGGMHPEGQYGSHGPGSFNINPAGGLGGLWVGEESMSSILGRYPTNLQETCERGSTYIGTNLVVSIGREPTEGGTLGVSEYGTVIVAKAESRVAIKGHATVDTGVWGMADESQGVLGTAYSIGVRGVATDTYGVKGSAFFYGGHFTAQDNALYCEALTYPATPTAVGLQVVGGINFNNDTRFEWPADLTVEVGALETALALAQGVAASALSNSITAINNHSNLVVILNNVSNHVDQYGFINLGSVGGAAASTNFGLWAASPDWCEVSGVYTSGAACLPLSAPVMLAGSPWGVVFGPSNVQQRVRMTVAAPGAALAATEAIVRASWWVGNTANSVSVWPSWQAGQTNTLTAAATGTVQTVVWTNTAGSGSWFADVPVTGDGTSGFTALPKLEVVWR